MPDKEKGPPAFCPIFLGHPRSEGGCSQGHRLAAFEPSFGRSSLVSLYRSTLRRQFLALKRRSAGSTKSENFPPRVGTGSEALCTRQTLALSFRGRRGGLLGMTRSDRFSTSAKCCDRLPASNRARVFPRLGGASYSNDYLIPKNSLDTKMRACYFSSIAAGNITHDAKTHAKRPLAARAPDHGHSL
jgi:hypothetical protein